MKLVSGILVLALCFASPCVLVYGQKSVQASQAPVPQTLNLNPDNLRALQNSVNLFTGQVSFPMELASLPGRGGLNISVSIQYNSSNVDKAIGVNNAYSPTGVLGLGWSMDIPQIVADNKQTGARQDDNFYLMEGGVSNPMITRSLAPSFGTFETSNFTAWKIEYYPLQERWVIVRENGFKYTYSAVQYMVKWGNWIGNSSQTQNQSRQAYVWALSEVENLWGDKLTFQYNQVEESVGSGGLAHTKAFYLSKVTDPIGQSITFNYLPKAVNEYQDPHQGRAEPDAYQEKYETMYLSSLTVQSASNSVLFSVALGFSTPDINDNAGKRYLMSIQKQFPAGEHQPAIEFEYFPADHTQEGYLKKVSNTLGAHIDYFYKSLVFDVSSTGSTISAPTGYGQPKLYVSGDYCVAIWRKLKAGGTVDSGVQPVKIQAYVWDGGWVLQNNNLWDIPNIENDDYEVAEIALQARHFVYRVYSKQQQSFLFYAAHLKSRVAPRGTTAIWEKKEITYHKDGLSPANDIGHVYAGEDFVCFNVRWLQTIEVQTWRDEQWVAQSLQIHDPEFENYLTAAGNFIFLHNDNKGGVDQLHLFYLNGEKEWIESRVPSGLLFTTEGPSAWISYWHACNAFVFGLPQYNPEYVFMWDENYTNFVKVNQIGEYHDPSWVSILNDGQVGLTQPNRGNGVALRYDGNSWYTQTYNYLAPNETSYAPDLVVRAENFFAYDKPSCLAHTFDPNTLQWKRQAYGSLDYDHMNTQYGRAIQAGLDMFMANQWLMTRQTDDTWYYGDVITLGASEYLVGNTAVVMAPNYVAYEYSSTPTGKPAGTYVLYLKNNRVVRSERLVGYGLDVSKSNAGLSILALKSLAPAPAIMLCHIAGQKTGGVTATVVSATIWNDGNHLFKTGYDYEKGRPNAMGVPQFNRVTVLPGQVDGDNSPNGMTLYCFYNGLPASELIDYSGLDAYAGMENLLTGLPYSVVTRPNIANTELSRTTYRYSIVSTPITNVNQRTIALKNRVRAAKTEQRTDGALVTVENTYDDATGLLKTSRRISSPTTSGIETLITAYTYWWEVYNPDRARNILSPVVQTKTSNSRTEVMGPSGYTSSVATKWTYNGTLDKYFPGSTYTWKQSGNSDFSAWTNAAAPSADWFLTSKVNELDLSDGTVFETERRDGTKAVSLYDATHTRIFASLTFSDFDQAAYSGFEDNAVGNWNYNASLVTTAAAYSGNRSLAAGSSDVRITSKTLPEDTYEVSFWSKGVTAVAEVTNGTILETASEEVQNGWTLVRAQIQVASGGGVIRIKVPSTSLIDEARLRPRGSEMATYVYDATGNVVVETDTNLFQRRFEYDTQYRLLAVKDHQGKVLKTYSYHYRNQP